MKTIAIIPAYNEERVIAGVISSLRPFVSDIVLIDDGSSDATSARAKSAGAITLRHFLNRGQGAALQTGIDHALNLGADIIVTFDADGQHDASDVEKLVEPVAESKCDVVLGSRFLGSVNKNMPFSRVVLLKIAVAFTRVTTGVKVTDAHNGLRAFSRKAAQIIKISNDGMAHASEIVDKIGEHSLSYQEVPVTITYTPYSLKKGQTILHSFKIMWELFIGKLSK